MLHIWRVSEISPIVHTHGQNEWVEIEKCQNLLHLSTTTGQHSSNLLKLLTPLPHSHSHRQFGARHGAS
jgi:hypothetical protein